MFDVPEFLSKLRSQGCSLGEPFTFFDTTNSTNTQAKLALRNGAPHGAVFLADEQTAGRGRQGKQWFARNSEALLFSIALRPRLPAEQLSGLTLVIGLGVRDALAAHTTTALNIKWPNDILAHVSDGAIKKKLAGILVETELTPDAATAVSCGVGVNIGMSEFPEGLRQTATSLHLLQGAVPSREQLLVESLVNIERWLTEFTRHGFARLVPALNAYDALAGERLRVTTPAAAPLRGVGAGIDGRGQLLLETTSGMRAISSGTVEFDPD